MVNMEYFRNKHILGTKKVTRKRTKLLNKCEREGDDNNNMSLIIRIVYSTGNGNLFKQPPSPTKADTIDVNNLTGDIEKGKVDIEPNQGDNVHESEIEDIKDNYDVGLSTGDTDHQQNNNNINVVKNVPKMLTKAK